MAIVFGVDVAVVFVSVHTWVASGVPVSTRKRRAFPSGTGRNSVAVAKVTACVSESPIANDPVGVPARVANEDGLKTAPLVHPTQFPVAVGVPEIAIISNACAAGLPPIAVGNGPFSDPSAVLLPQELP